MPALRPPHAEWPNASSISGGSSRCVSGSATFTEPSAPSGRLLRPRHIELGLADSAIVLRHGRFARKVVTG